jgi:hypothetical protein
MLSSGLFEERRAFPRAHVLRPRYLGGNPAVLGRMLAEAYSHPFMGRLHDVANDGTLRLSRELLAPSTMFSGYCDSQHPARNRSAVTGPAHVAPGLLALRSAPQSSDVQHNVRVTAQHL